MVKVICGMIGSGKTTYALKNKSSNDILLDWDLLAEALKTDNKVWIKENQDILLKFYAKKNCNIWYITTKLGSNEIDILNQIKDIEYIWINTTKKQCVENIRKRNRNNEIKYIKNILKANEIIYSNYYNNIQNIKYNIINVFDSNERW